MPSPLHGEHSAEVFERILGIAGGRYEELVRAGVTGMGPPDRADEDGRREHAMDHDQAQFEQIRYEVVGRVARVTLDRPDYKNAQSRRLREEMDAAFDLAVEDREVRVIVLRGEGDTFSSGHDLGTPEERADLEARPYEEGVRGEYRRTWDLNVANSLRWRDLPKPTIAAVQGYCIFGGWIIASAMDLIFAADDAKFLPANFQYFSVPWDLGVRKTKEILFEARFLDASEALELGFVNRVVPRDRLDEEVMAYAVRVAENDPFQLRMTKLAVNQMQDLQGFRAHIEASHATYMLGAADGGVGRVEGRQRLGSVQRAFEREASPPPPDTSG